MAEYPVNVARWITKWATIKPEKQAIIWEDVPCTYRELEQRINKVCHFLLGIGVEKGDRVAVLLRNSRQYVETFFALSKTGAIMVPLNWRLSVPELEFIIEDSESSVVIFEGDFLENATRLREKIPIDTQVCCTLGEARTDRLPPWALDYEEAVMGQPAEEPPVPWPSGDNDPHILMYTSGTTGVPKGAILSHTKTFFNVLNANMYFDLTSSDVLLVSRPLFHSGGLIVETVPMLYRGGTVVVRRRFRPEEILETIERYGVTILELPATVYNFILKDCDLSRHNLSSLKCCFTGGERVPVSMLQAYAEKGIFISQIYGLTEASTLFWLPYDRAGEKMGSVGQPVFHGEVRIVNEEGDPVGPGETGEIIVRGPVVMNGYWKREDLTAEVIVDGWLHTGDLARRDEEGFVYILDRKKDMFISGGENVYPAEIEKVLVSHPAILDAAVVGVPDERWGEVGRAFVVLREGFSLDGEAVRDFLNDKVGRFKIPRYVEFVDALPKTASGKIQKRLLRAAPLGN